MPGNGNPGNNPHGGAVGGAAQAANKYTGSEKCPRPLFHGDSSIDSWASLQDFIDALESFFRAYQTADADKTAEIRWALLGPASAWYDIWIRNNRDDAVGKDWAAFQLAFKKRFKITLSYSAAAQAFSNLSQRRNESSETFWDRCDIAANALIQAAPDNDPLKGEAASAIKKHQLDKVTQLTQSVWLPGLRPDLRRPLFSNVAWKSLEECRTTATALEQAAAEFQPGHAVRAVSAGGPPTSNSVSRPTQPPPPPPSAGAPPAADTALLFQQLGTALGMAPLAHVAPVGARPASRQPRAAPHPDQPQTHGMHVSCRYCTGKGHIAKNCSARAANKADRQDFQ